MTGRRRSTPTARTTRVAIAGAFIAGSALLTAGPAGAEPAPPVPMPPPGVPIAAPPMDPAAPPPPPPVGPPPIPEMQNPVYGQGQTEGPFGYLRDIWRAARGGDPVGSLTTPLEEASGPPPGAGPAPPLPPGFVSKTAPESTTSLPGEGTDAGPAAQGPALPPGYHSLDGPPPPGWYDAAPEAAPGVPLHPELPIPPA